MNQELGEATLRKEDDKRHSTRAGDGGTFNIEGEKKTHGT